MLALEVELLHGSIRAGSPDDTTLSGAEDEGEWPPSPARVFAALVAGGGTRARCVLGDERELRALEAAHPPRVFADNRAVVLVSPQVERYVVANQRDSGSVQEYPARKATLVRPATRLAPRTPSVTYVWDSLDLSSAQCEALAARAARVAYLGCADSPVRMRLVRAPLVVSEEREWTPSEDGDVFLPVPFTGLLDILDDAFDRFQGGEPVRRSWLPVARARYRRPSSSARPRQKTTVSLWLRFDVPASGRHALSVGETLKAALLDLYDRHVAGGAGAPAVLHGHGFGEHIDYDHASFLPLIDCGHPHARGRIYGAAVVLPGDTPGEVVEGVRSALFHLRQLALPGGRVLGVELHAGEERPWAAHPKRWTASSRSWVSVTPVVHERRRRGGPDLEEVARWCLHAGVPRPVSFALGTRPFVAGGAALRPDEVFHSNASRRPYTHLRVTFAEPVSGPIALGRMRHLGIGLMVPLRRDGLA